MNTPYLDREHFVVKVQAGKLLQIAGWGTICVSFLTSFILILQYFVFITGAVVPWYIGLYDSSNNTTISIFISAIVIIQMISILPSILYSAFLITLWLYFRYKTKVKYSGYSSDDPKVLEQVHNPETDMFSNQDKFHFTYYKHKNRVMITTYVVCVVLVSVMFAAFFAPVLSEKWKRDISLKPGDYYLLEHSVLKDGCSDDRFSFTVNQSYNWYSTEIDLNCSENIFAGELLFNETFYTTYNYIATGYYDQVLVWLPKNSTLESDPTIAIQSEYPCYYDPYVYFYTYDNNMVNQLGIDSCIGAKIIQDPYQPNFTTCNYTQRGQQHCKILTTGMYHIDGNITVQQFGYTILEHTLTPLNKVKGEQLSNYDVILFNSFENIPNIPYTFCMVHASCLFNPFFRILMPVLILLCSMIALTIGLVSIHKI